MATIREPNVFNDMAIMICILRKLNRTAFDDKITRKSSRPDSAKTMADGFISEHPDLQQNGQQLLASGISPETMQALRDWLKVQNNPFYDLLEILRKLEQKIDTKDLLESEFYTKLTGAGTKEFESLNSNANETEIFILPKVASIYSPPSSDEDEEPKDSLKFVGSNRSGIGNELINIYYYEKEELTIRGNSYQALHSVLRVPGLRDVNRDTYQNKQKVTIAVSPLTNERLDDYCSFNDHGTAEAPNRRFSVQFRDSNNCLAQRIQKDIEAAGDAGADIVIFPEMFGCKETVTATDSLLYPLPETNVLARAAESLGEKLPSLILLPTWWHDYSNQLYVRSSPERILCVQQKQFPFLAKKSNHDYREDLQNQDHIIHMVHIPGLGRFAFPICRDIIEETGYVDLMRKTLWATFLLCPSYSPHKMQFGGRGSSAPEYGCYIIWCNACGAYYNHVFNAKQDETCTKKGAKAKALEPYLGFVASPLFTGAQITFFKPKCNGMCGEDGVCLFLIDLKWDGSELSGSVEPYQHIYH